ncbi:unnamed protein product [Danaus chrysippus]|uniref:(African queen) hypothetical protein n=1 Tax=Danaus chrysippus TaxID=151541 RepID=A0A8J2QWT7_9NEOP|nr:unnamed protein product [Danaus chrysippus]
MDKSEIMETEEVKVDKTDKLPFSIDSLLADKNSVGTSDSEYNVFKANYDDESSGSEQLDVETSTMDVQEFADTRVDYQTGI